MCICVCVCLCASVSVCACACACTSRYTSSVIVDSSTKAGVLSPIWSPPLSHSWRGAAGTMEGGWREGGGVCVCVWVHWGMEKMQYR